MRRDSGTTIPTDSAMHLEHPGAIRLSVRPLSNEQSLRRAREGLVTRNRPCYGFHVHRNVDRNNKEVTFSLVRKDCLGVLTFRT